jgi:hypothetical protein
VKEVMEQRDQLELEVELVGRAALVSALRAPRSTSGSAR